MPRRNESSERGELLRLVVRWRETVESAARGLRGDPRTYEVLHAELLQCSRSLAESGNEENKTLYENVVELVQIWLNTEALNHANQAILTEVIQRSQQIERILGAPSWTERYRRWSRPLLKILVASMGVGGIVWASIRWWLPVKSTLKGIRLQISLALDRMGVAERWMLGGTIAVLIAMVLLSRTAKS